jgi:uncharacterized protein YfkK (UPF0435 family)
MNKVRKGIAFNKESERDMIAYDVLNKYTGKGKEFSTKIKLINYLVLNADKFQNEGIEPFITEVIYREIARRKHYGK